MGELRKFNSIRSQDLKHIYTCSPKSLKCWISKRKDLYNLKGKDEHLDPQVLKSSEFVREYRCHIPRAPAFRIFSRDEVDKMVDRVNKDTYSTVLRKYLTEKAFSILSADEEDKMGRSVKKLTESKDFSVRNEQAMLDDKKTNQHNYLKLKRIASMKEQEKLIKKIARDAHSRKLRTFLTRPKVKKIKRKTREKP